jgi:hypothetical protein
VAAKAVLGIEGLLAIMGRLPVACRHERLMRETGLNGALDPLLERCEDLGLIQAWDGEDGLLCVTLSVRAAAHLGIEPDPIDSARWVVRGSPPPKEWPRGATLESDVSPTFALDDRPDEDAADPVEVLIAVEEAEADLFSNWEQVVPAPASGTSSHFETKSPANGPWRDHAPVGEIETY